MFTVLVNVEALASRAVSPRPARGTTSRVINRRLTQSFHTSNGLLTPTLVSTLQQDKSDVLQSIPGSSRSSPADHRGLLRQNDAVSGAVGSRHASVPGLKGPFAMKAMKAEASKAEQLDTSTHDVRSRGLIEALEQGDTRRIHTYTTQLLSGSKPGDAMRAAVAGLPQTAFSELLRCLDPFVISKELDAGHDIAIGPGMASFTPLGELLNKYGLKILYVKLLRALLFIRNLRRQAGHRLLLSDYIILLRCAGAALDVDAAKTFQRELETFGYKDWWQGDIYNEFCKARFLTEPLYTQHDLARFRVRPRNLHRSKVMLPSADVLKLDMMRTAMLRRNLHRFGQNSQEGDYAEHLTRILRKRKPVFRAIAEMQAAGATPDEKLLCTLMIAHGRTGGVQPIWGMLERYWGIIVRRDRQTGDSEITGGHQIPPDSPLRPTARLLDAITHGLCCSGEVSVALKLVDFVSTRYQLRIPARTWSALLEWTYVLASRNVAREWKIARFPQKAMTGNAVRLVWDTMVSEPYNHKPGLRDYNVLVKVLIGQNRLRQAMEVMRELRYLYDDALRENEDALFELVQTLDQGVEPALAMQRYRTAQSHKLHTWYCFSLWCSSILKRIRAKELDQELTTRVVPRFIDEFKPFMPRQASYRTATGYVDIVTRNTLQRFTTRKQSLEIPAQGFRVPHDGDGSLSAIPWISQHRARLARGPERRTAWVRRPETQVPDLLGPRRALPAAWLEREFT